MDIRGKPSMLGGASGAIAGLVAITPACGWSGPMGAICLGVVAGSVCFVAVTSLKAGWVTMIPWTLSAYTVSVGLLCFGYCCGCESITRRNRRLGLRCQWGSGIQHVHTIHKPIVGCSDMYSLVWYGILHCLQVRRYYDWTSG